MADHPLATRTRDQFRSLWVDGDPQPTFDALADDVIWRNDIGAGPFRQLHGKDEVIAMILWWTDFFDGSFRQELIDVCASDRHVIEVLRETGTKEGHVFDNVALYQFEVDSRHPDRISSVQTFDRDRDQIAEFWAHYPDIAAADGPSLLAPPLGS